MIKLVLEAQKRSVFGRKTKTLRREGILPANIYGKKVKSLSIQVPAKQFEKIFSQAGETNIIELKVDKDSKSRHVLTANLQKDPVSDLPLHVDFHQVDLTEKVTVAVPIELSGESPAVKEKGGILLTLLDEVRVEALPRDLPDKFVLDISRLTEIGDSLVIKDLKLDKKKITILADQEETIATIQEPKLEEEEVPPAEKEELEAKPEEEAEKLEEAKESAPEKKQKKAEAEKTRESQEKSEK